VSARFLLDTNISSELTKPLPDASVIAWVKAQPDTSLYMSVVSAGELRRGFCLLAQSRRRTTLEDWFHQDLLPLFEDRVLPVTQSITERWGRLSAERQRTGRPLSMPDGLIAATALEHDLILVTRNVKDFAGLDVPILNPWAVPLEQPYRT